MPKKIKNVFFKSLTFQKFLEAHNRAKKNKMYKNEVLKFDLNLESNIISIINGIKNNTFKVADILNISNKNSIVNKIVFLMLVVRLNCLNLKRC